MIKSELIEAIAHKINFDPQPENPNPIDKEKITEDCVNNILDYLSDSLSHGRRIEVRGFGSFSLHYRPSRRAHNPKTGKKLVTEPKHSPHFKPGKELRERVNNSIEFTPFGDLKQETGDSDDYQQAS